MQCTGCGSSNLDTARYCSDCGVSLADGDATSVADMQRKLDMAQDAVHRLRRYIPSVVADGILYDQGRLRGERREVTILFVDVVNFTSLSASLDAEPLFELVNGLLGRLMECVHRYAGVVDKFLVQVEKKKI